MGVRGDARCGPHGVLLLRAIAWAAKEPVDRFNDLATVGVKLKD